MFDDTTAAVDGYAELVDLISMKDEDDRLQVLKHSTVYADGQRCVDYEVKVTGDCGGGMGPCYETVSIMLTAEQVMLVAQAMADDMIEEELTRLLPAARAARTFKVAAPVQFKVTHIGRGTIQEQVPA